MRDSTYDNLGENDNELQMNQVCLRSTLKDYLDFFCQVQEDIQFITNFIPNETKIIVNSYIANMLEIIITEIIGYHRNGTPIFIDLFEKERGYEVSVECRGSEYITLIDLAFSIQRQKNRDHRLCVLKQIIEKNGGTFQKEERLVENRFKEIKYTFWFPSGN